MAAEKKGNHLHILFRYGVVTILILLFSGAIGYKLFSTTVIDAPHWNEKARKQLEKVDTILPERGDILSDKGDILATNLRYYTVRVDFRCENFKQHQYQMALDQLADSMGKYFPVRTRDQWRKRLEEPLKSDPKKRPRAWPLITNISYLDLQRIKTFPFFSIGNRNKTGMTVESVMRRSNPYGAMARRSVGGVGQTAECKEIHGIYGLEKALDSLLYGAFTLCGCVLTFLIFVSVHEATSPNWLYLWLNPLCAIPAVCVWIKRCKRVVYWYQICNFAALILLLSGHIFMGLAMNPAFPLLILCDLMRSATQIYVYRGGIKPHATTD